MDLHNANKTLQTCSIVQTKELRIHVISENPNRLNKTCTFSSTPNNTALLPLRGPLNLSSASASSSCWPIWTHSWEPTGRDAKYRRFSGLSEKYPTINNIKLLVVHSEIDGPVQVYFPFSTNRKQLCYFDIYCSLFLINIVLYHNLINT